MKKKDDSFRLSASDLSNYLSCQHLTELDISFCHDKRIMPEWNNPHTDILQEMGYEHEDDYINHLKKSGKNVTVIEGENTHEKTLEAIKRGDEIIVQGVLKLDLWYGRSDILMRVDTPSKLGDYSYEIQDTKLSQETKAGSILQLCLYSEMLNEVQGVFPEFMKIIIPGNNFEPLEYRVDDYMAYFRLVKNQLLKSIGQYDEKVDVVSYPEPTNHCDLCRWWADCNKRRRQDDHLGFTAGISKKQMKELKLDNVDTMKKLSELKDVDQDFEKVFNQARIQVEGREKETHLYEILEAEENRGFNKLPEPTEDDIYFDIEGDTYVGDNGIEYLLGYSYLDNGELKYTGKYSFSFEEEKKAYEWFIDEVMRRIEKNPNMHIYHYAPYEPSAIKRMMGKYGSREQEVDILLRSGKFIDLYSVTRQAIRASVEKYSIKDLEIFYDFKRKADLNTMIFDKRGLEHALELGQADKITEKMKETVRIYNQDDTDSTYFLQKWLEKVRCEAIDSGAELNRPELISGEANEEVSEIEAKFQALKEKLQKGLPVAVEDRNEDEQALWLLSDLIGFFRREEKVAFWEIFRLRELDAYELKEDKAGLSGLRFIQEFPMSGRQTVPVHRYKFSAQELDFKAGDDVSMMGAGKFGKIEYIDKEKRIIDIKKTKNTAQIHPKGLYKSSMVPSKTLSEALYTLGEYVAEKGLNNLDRYQAGMSILRRLAPKLKNGEINISEKDKLSDIISTINNLDNSYLPIQGPPGAGKSYTGSHVISSLIEQGKKVGIVAVSHKVITGLLTSVSRVIDKKGIDCRLVHKTSSKSDGELPYEELTTNPKVLKAILEEAPIVVGGTSWLFANPNLIGELDYIFIDEAGQLSLANVLSFAGCAKNIVMLGDPQQLEQPIQGAHPEGCSASALEHILGDHQTIPEDMGVFLNNTYRLHPKICEFNSELFYENRLDAISGNEKQIITGSSIYTEKALMISPVSHDSNTNSSIEEVEKIKSIVSELIGTEHKYTLWENDKEVTKVLEAKDIMIVAPYNAQVQLLKEHLPELEIGTVDKFQGREAPIVLYSMTTSSPDDAPRGMEFLYSLNRLNVAVSRAQCSFILVSNSSVFSPDCKGPRQMQLANALCRYLEMAQEV